MNLSGYVAQRFLAGPKPGPNQENTVHGLVSTLGCGRSARSGLRCLPSDLVRIGEAKKIGETKQSCGASQPRGRGIFIEVVAAAALTMGNRQAILTYAPTERKAELLRQLAGFEGS
eukprot:scaffold2808_cov255-Pinguiococcus_pyrenoidosus.AAC.26